MPDAPLARPVAPGVSGHTELANAAELFKALGAAVRLAIVVELAKAPRSAQELAGVLGVRQPLVSQHLRMLRSLGWSPPNAATGDVYTDSPTSRCATSSPMPYDTPSTIGPKDAAHAACVHVEQVQSRHVQLLQPSAQCSHWHMAWLQLGQLQSAQSHTAQESEQFAQLQASHSS
jgi:Bacterial regulatory protein, arsR family